LTRAVLPHMPDGGAIVNTTSVTAVAGHLSPPHHLACTISPHTHVARHHDVRGEAR